ncbi:MAG TPA: DUF6689 family protein [Thermoanaerobaculia bacterium]|nr:DUF6689 family protein [Thermoanaerobaculia bacterium]
MRTWTGYPTRFLLAALSALALLLPAVDTEAGITSVTISGDEAEIEIDVGLLSAEMLLTFEDVTGLTEANLGLDASATSILDTALLARLPSLTSLVGGLLLVAEVDPPSTGGLEFDGIVTVELYTTLLTYTSGTKWRLFAAHGGGNFHDVTELVDGGSYRVRGSKGSFSEFLILLDLRSIDTIIEAKFDRLWDLLDEYDTQIDSDVLDDLEDLLADSEEDYDEDELALAITHLEDFADEVVDHSGSDVPETWRAARDLDNVAGLLRAAAATLDFSLDWKLNN